MSRLNLLPPDIREEIALSKKNYTIRHYILTSLAVLFSLLAFFGVLFFYLNLQKQEAVAQKTFSQKQIDEQTVSYEKAKDLYTRINLIKKIKKGSTNWYVVLDEIAGRTPQNVNLDNFTVGTKDARTKIVGLALTDKDVVAFKENLAESKLFDFVDIENITKTKDKNGRDIKSFTITLTIKNGTKK